MIPAGRQIVTSPNFTPLPYGLFSVVEEVSGGGDPHWQMGVMHQPDVCGAALSTVTACPTVTVITKAPSATGIPVMGADAFTVYAYVDCGPVGRADPSQWEDVALAHLANGEERAVESVFWTGNVPTVTGGHAVMPHLAEDTLVIDSSTGSISQLAASPVVTGNLLDVVEAVGALEGALGACYGGVGVIHVPRAAIAHLSSKSLITREDGQLRTLAGNLIAAGAGYPGTSPAGSIPVTGTGWFYATGAVKMWRSSPALTSTTVEALDKAENDLVLVAERTYVLTWDCCLFAAQVRLGGFDSGTAASPD